VISPQAEQAPQPQQTNPQPLPRICVISDAAPERNGVGAYYSDLSQRLEDHVSARMIAPVFHRSWWRGGLQLPLPGDSTQRLCLPNPATLSRQLADHRPHVVIIATPGPFGLLGMRAARRQGARIIVGFHTHFENVTDLYWSPAIRWVVRGYFAWSHRVLFGRGEVVLANSPAMVTEARRFGAKKVLLMGTPLHGDFIDTPVVPTQPQVKKVLFAGRLSAEKNILSVLAAAEALPKIQFHIAGDGPLRHTIEAACKRLKNLIYLGWLPRTDLRATLDNVDALVLPSHVESFGTVALEAMARGRLAIVSPTCGICEWPELAQGLVVMGEAESLTETVQRVVALPVAKRQKITTTARQQAVALNQSNLTSWLDLIGQDT